MLTFVILTLDDWQILVQHIRAILPDLKARISTQMINIQKELASYGELTESKVSLNFCSYCPDVPSDPCLHLVLVK